MSGYDMARLHIGGLGTLGVISEVSFKLTPLPPKEATVVAAFDSSEQCLNAGLDIFHSHVTPLALTSFDSRVNERARVMGLDGSHFLAVRLGGRPRTLERQLRECSLLCHQHGATTIESLDRADASVAWRRVADFGWDETSTPVMAGRVSAMPSKIAGVTRALEQPDGTSGLHPAIIAHPGYGNVLIHWFSDGNAVPDEAVVNVLRQTRETVHHERGRLIIERCPQSVKSEFDVWDDVGEPLTTMRRMKEQYDPKGILNPGRFVGGI